MTQASCHTMILLLLPFIQASNKPFFWCLIFRSSMIESSSGLCPYKDHDVFALSPQHRSVSSFVHHQFLSDIRHPLYKCLYRFPCTLSESISPFAYSVSVAFSRVVDFRSEQGLVYVPSRCIIPGELALSLKPPPLYAMSVYKCSPTIACPSPSATNPALWCYIHVDCQLDN